MKTNKLLKLFTLIVICVFALSMFAGCGTKEETPVADTKTEEKTEDKVEEKTEEVEESGELVLKDDVEIDLSYMASTGSLEADCLGVAYLKWVEEHPNVKLTLNTVDAGETGTKVLTWANSNNLPDIFWATADTLNAVWNAENGSALDLTSYISEELKANTSEDAFSMLYSKDGEIMGFPVYMVCQGFMYNEDLFKQYGLEIPETYDELVECVKVFAANDVVTIAAGTKDTFATWSYIFWQQLWGFEDQKNDVFGTNTIKYQDSDIAQSFYKIAELAELGAFPKNNATLDFDQCCAMFGSGQAAMITQSSGQAYRLAGCEIEDSIVFDWGPTFTDSKHDQEIGIRMSSNGYGVSSNVTDDELAAIIDLNEYRFTPEGVQQALNIGLVVPCAMDVETQASMEGSNIAKQNLKLITDTSITPIKTTTYDYKAIWNNYEGVKDFEDNYVNYIFWGIVDGTFTKDDLPDLLSRANDQIEKIISISGQ